LTVPWGSGEVLEIDNGGHITVTLRDFVVVPPIESVTRTVKLDVPVAVGVPDRSPLEVRAIPAGNVPADRLHA
jgi:hypothetical protein